MKRCSTCQQFGTWNYNQMGSLSIPIRMDKIKKNDNAKCWWGCEKQNHSHIIEGNVK